MNRLMLVFTASVTLLVSGFGQAQDLFGTVNVFAPVTFYKGHPESGGFKLATIGINNSPIAPTLIDVGNATYVTIPFQDTLYTFALAESGWNKENIMLTVPKSSGGMVQPGYNSRVSLAELFNTLATDQTILARLSGETLAAQ